MAGLKQWLKFAERKEEGGSFPNQLVYSDFRSTEEIRRAKGEGK